MPRRGAPRLEKMSRLDPSGPVRCHAVLLTLVLSALFVGQAACRLGSSATALPERLSDEEFWSLSTALSEPAGTFEHSENLVSNETRFVHLIRTLRPSGGVYIGVGPEQNFSYIAALRPAMAFIIDIRQENRNLHLLYKALFELADDRADFVSRLFSRRRPDRMEPETRVQDLFEQLGKVKPAFSLYEASARLVRGRLFETHGFPLSPQDFEWIDHALNAFYSDGPGIHYARSRPDDPPGPSYRLLMTMPDIGGQSRSYLATEEGFALVKDLQARNMIVPIVGDFAGPSAIRRVGDYIRRHGGIVEAFYGSNVEVYLNREKAIAFCGNLSTLPHDSGSWFIGSKGRQRLSAKLQACGNRGR